MQSEDDGKCVPGGAACSGVPDVGVACPPLALASSASLSCVGLSAASILSASPVHLFPACHLYATPTLAAGPSLSSRPCWLLPLSSSMLGWRVFRPCSSGAALSRPGPGATSGGLRGPALLSSCLLFFFQSGWNPLCRANGGGAAHPSQPRHDKRAIEC